VNHRSGTIWLSFDNEMVTILHHPQHYLLCA
jgi:hypothetical protein